MNIFQRIHLLARYGKFGSSSFIDSDARVCGTSTLQPPCRIAGGARIKKTQIGRHSYVSRSTRIHNTTIGNFCSIGPECLIGGLGMHPKGLFSTSPLTYSPNHPASRILGSTGVSRDFIESGPVTLGHDVWIGARCIINDRVSIGTGAIIGANTVVTKDVPPYAIVFGSPTKIQGYRFSDEQIESLLASRWWDLSLGEIAHHPLLTAINQTPNEPRT